MPENSCSFETKSYLEYLDLTTVKLYQTNVVHLSLFFARIVDVTYLLSGIV
jgi:hypothetical protein